MSMLSSQSPHRRPLPVIGQRTLIMGILNVTPDSFSDGGRLPNPHAVVDRAADMIAAGADVLDLGGESTRPGAPVVAAEEESARVLPALAALRTAFPNIPISIDTYKASVARSAIEAGADIINDVWGLMHGLDLSARSQWREIARAESATRMEPPPSITPMARVATELNAPVILMHNRLDRNYGEFMEDVLLDLRASLALARAAGIAEHQLWIDPGFGFAKSVPQNLEVLRQLNQIVALGHPVLVGTSRKSTLGVVSGSAVDDRIEAGGATIVWAIQQGCHMVRVHDVREMARFARMADAIKAGLGFAPS
jgi:dihydropteroate synthase